MKKLLLIIGFVALSFGKLPVSFALNGGHLSSNPLEGNHMAIFFDRRVDKSAPLIPNIYSFLTFENSKFAFKMCYKDSKIKSTSCSGNVQKTSDPKEMELSVNCWETDSNGNKKNHSSGGVEIAVESYKKVVGNFYSSEVDPLTRYLFSRPILLRKFSKKLITPQAVSCQDLFQKPKAYQKIRKIERNFKTVLRKTNEEYANDHL